MQYHTHILVLMVGTHEADNITDEVRTKPRPGKVFVVSTEWVEVVRDVWQRFIFELYFWSELLS